jgi:hypothetical protein
MNDEIPALSITLMGNASNEGDDTRISTPSAETLHAWTAVARRRDPAMRRMQVDFAVPFFSQRSNWHIARQTFKVDGTTFHWQVNGREWIFSLQHIEQQGRRHNGFNWPTPYVA